jgi:aldehyde dehydrogenase (NAD+)
MACLLNNGQACYNGTRILAPASRYKQVVDAVSAMVSSFKVGDPLDRATSIGPMASAAHRERVETYIAKGKTEAKLIAGGGRPKGLDRGWFVEPTVFADLDGSSSVSRDEVFGPVLSVQPFTGVDDAIAVANDSEYGLGGTIWTSDEDRGLELARRVQSGSVGVNFFDLDLGSPFGGVKSSGLGRELGPEGLAAYVSYKSIYTRATA